MSQLRPATIAQLRANRRNGRLSRGPKTVESRRRANLNRRQLQLPQAAHDILKRLDAQPGDFYRVWRDLLTIFWFLGPSMEPYVGAVAWDWWLKQHARRGSGQHVLGLIDARLEESLWDLVNAYALLNRRWRVKLEREIGSCGELATALEGVGGDSLRPGKAIAEPNHVKRLCFRRLSPKSGAKIERFDGVEPTADKVLTMTDGWKAPLRRTSFQPSRIVTCITK